MATIMHYPTKEEPMGWRVQDKVLKEQKYFPISRFGSLDNAEAEALKFTESLNTRRKFRKLRLELPFNLLFDDLGLVRGLTHITRTIKGVKQNHLKIQITANGKQTSNTRLMDGRNFSTIYIELLSWAASKHGFHFSPELVIHAKKVMNLHRMH
ncbi:hypothetical protein [Vibrio sp. D431a]|uniref:hypothetical protein n=1 Tax=Vibrio sp. D431a TaxID=2837388 RepID=UPI0025522EF5|nr:hypothetical protein [Vibrio sp. D431a]MDK9793698.1 hypothetical protein [Vibrio sp. D431a]